MRHIHKLCLLIFIAVLLMITGLDRHSTSAKQSDPLGVLDFSDDKLQSKELYTVLDGDWYFFEKVLLTPHEVKEQLSHGMGRVVSLPSSFQTQTGDVNSYGTYSVAIKVPEEYVGETLAIHIPFQYSAYILYVDQIEVTKNGVVGQDPASHVAEMAPRTGYFIAQADEVLLTIQVSSFEHIRGDLRTPFI